MHTLEYDATCAYSAPTGKILTRGYEKKLEECGRTTCCYLAQRMFLIEQAIFNLGYGIDNDIVKRVVDLVFMSLQHSSFDPIFNNLDNVPQQNARIIEIINKFFEGISEKAQTQEEYDFNHQEKFKLTERLRYITQIGSSNLTDKLTPLSEYGIGNLFDNGGTTLNKGVPISLVLRNAKTKPEGCFYDVDHWCVFHNGKFRGTWGADDAQFRWNAHEVSPVDLAGFVECISAAKNLTGDKEAYDEQYKIFKNFLKTYMTPPEDLVSQSAVSVTSADLASQSVDNFIDKNYKTNFHDYAIEIIHGWQYRDETNNIEDKELFNTIQEVIRTLHVFGMIVQKKKRASDIAKLRRPVVPVNKTLLKTVDDFELNPTRDPTGKREEILISRDDSYSLETKDTETRQNAKKSKNGGKKTRKKRKRRTRKVNKKRKRNISLKKRR